MAQPSKRPCPSARLGAINNSGSQAENAGSDVRLVGQLDVFGYSASCDPSGSKWKFSKTVLASGSIALANARTLR